MKYLKTEKCVVCGEKAIGWTGYVIAKEKMALGNYIDKKIIAGYCEQHLQEQIKKENISNEQHQYYNNKLMGRCIPLF